MAGWAWLKVRDEKRQPPLRLAIEGRHNGETYYRYAKVGALAPEIPPIREDWAPYTFQVDDLPHSGLTELRVGFDLMGEGEVWVDDVQLFDIWFSKNERNELTKNIALADLYLGEGQVSDCQRFLDGYWAKFLVQHVPFDEAAVAARPAEASAVRNQTAAKDQPERAGEKEKPLLNRWKRFAPAPTKILPFYGRTPRPTTRAANQGAAAQNVGSADDPLLGRPPGRN